MARVAQILIPGSPNEDIKIAALGTSTASSAQLIGKYRPFVINSDQDIAITFGDASVADPTAANYRIPANQQTTLEMGAQFTHLKVFNLSSSTAANIWIKPLHSN